MSGVVDFGRVCLAGAVLLPLAAAPVALAGGPLPRRSRRVARLAWGAALLAVGSTVVVAWRGPFGLARLGSSSTPLLWADPLTVTLLVLGCGVGAVVQSFSVRYLQADPNAPRLAAAANLVVGATALVATAGALALLVGAWVAAGASFLAAMGYRRDLPGVGESVAATARRFAVGDSALVAALVIVWARAGDVELVAPGAIRAATGHLGGLGTVVALLVVTAALCRSAQGPFRRWLPGTVSAPTPVSALLHAGVVNGGGVLLVRLGGLSGTSTPAMVVAFAVAAVTAGFASGVAARKPDVKGSLVFSTIAQMGFMIAECSVGAYLAAVVHLVGHGLYKATLFLGSGSWVRRPGDRPPLPTPERSSTPRVLAATGAAGAASATVAAFPGVLAARGGVVLLVFVAVTAATGGWGWWGHRPGSRGATLVVAAAMIAASGIYGLALAGAGSWIAPSLPTPGAGTLDPWWLLAAGVSGLAAAGLARLPATRWWWTGLALDAGWGTSPGCPQ